MSIDFDTPISVDNPNDVNSWLQGFLYACQLFGVWKDGQQYLGVGDFTVEKVKAEIKRFEREQL